MPVSDILWQQVLFVPDLTMRRVDPVVFAMGFMDTDN